MRTYLVKFDGLDLAARRERMDEICQERGWSVHLGIHPHPPETRHLRYRIDAEDAEDLRIVLLRANLPKGVKMIEAWEQPRSPFRFERDR